MIRQLAAAAALAFLCSTSLAATLTWTGTVSSSWANAGNWNPVLPPATGDDLVFGLGANPPANNDLVGVILHSVTATANQAGAVTGNPISLQSGGFIDDVLPGVGFTFNVGLVLNGPATLRGQSFYNGVISGVGGLTVAPLPTIQFNAVNTYSGTTTVNSTSVGGLLGANVGGAIPVGSAVTIVQGGIGFGASSAIGSLAGVGSVNVDTGSTLTVGGDNSSTTYSGTITQSGGNASLVKTGTGTMTLSGASTYAGTTTVAAGRLDVISPGSIQSATTVNAGATLGGTGTVNAPVTVNTSATLAPGVSPGIINTGNLVLAGTLQIEINGTTMGAQYDQINVTGTVNVTNGTLAVTTGAVIPGGSVLTIINNDGADAITGPLLGLPEGSTVSVGGNVFAVSYVGGNGNDLTLTALAVPGAPVIGAATPGNGQATINFTAPASNGGSPITGYTATCNPGAITGAGGAVATSIVVGGLTNGTPYTCSVTATNALGTSVPSGTVGVTPATVAGAPTIGAATPGNEKASIAFTPPASNGGFPITSYTMTCNPGAIAASGPASPIVVTGLTNGTAYTCSVTATTSQGTGPASATVSVTPFTIPGAPTIGAATPGSGQASIAFTPPASNGGSAITSFTATCNPGGITGSGAASPVTVTGLTNGTVYSCSVTATNAAGTGPASGTVSAAPVAVVVTGSALPTPTLSEWAIGLLALLILASGAGMGRRLPVSRSRPPPSAR